ncbi:putative AMP binding protein [Cutaneotrichosporon oleaginosum]|uniref:Putative AMP binding protein n=1 Tax=Cutaneotrichosporon oleaginosum TaxID=879819 RepID=A0A0J0XDG0_9TREE|nr:putative AMP binding protein [Cutaneotrichosporon oleaginosum]KLT39116.1 putative AMP binding protein [Cutaneotrichosporon oleaginosum]
MPFTSDYPDVTLPEVGIFEYHFPANPQFDPDLPAFIDGIDGRTITRRELEDGALRLATGLRSLGLKRHDVACMFGLNSLEWVRAAYGCMAAGMTVSPANWAYSPKELAHQINDSDAQIIFIAPDLVPKFDETRQYLKRSFPDSRVVLMATKENQPIVKRYKVVTELYGTRGKPERFSGKQAYETTWLCYSSGTTGLPKGVMTTHHNFTSQLQALKVACQQLTPQDAMLAFVPLSHTYGSTMVLQQPFSMGCPVVLLPKFEEQAALAAIEKYKITHGLIVPPIVIVLLHSELVPKYDLRSLRTLMCAAAPLGDELTKAFESRFPNCVVTQGYGLTETTPIITCLTGEEVVGRSGWVGRLLPTYEARLVDPDGNDVTTPLERGELWVRGPSVMKGYHKNPAATANTFHDGWFKTGDVLIRSEDGWYKVVDRVKELIKYKGFQVPPAELEALLMTHPKIKDTAVVGIYDKSQATELPTAYVVVGSDVDTSDEGRAAFDKEIQAWVAARAARHKRLGGGVWIVDEIPKSPSGKILRRFLRDKGQAERDARVAQGVQAKL